MLRSFKLHCALGTLALACGGATDDSLFGDAAGRQNGGTSAGGRADSSGGTTTSPTGGRATVTGGRASSTGGAEDTDPAQGGDVSSGSGGTSGGLPGMGGTPNDGGAAPRGGTSTGGTTQATGGSPDGNGGASANGGATGGSGGSGAGGAPTGKGGAGGTVSCQEAREAATHALDAAQACNTGPDEQCLGFVDGECCPVPVNDPTSAEAQEYQAALAKMNKVCGPSLCPAILCVAPTAAVCQEKGSEAGRCVSKSILGM